MALETIYTAPMRVTPTAETHYDDEEFEYHLHDLCYNSEEIAVAGDPEQAAFNLKHMLQFQREDGFLSNQVLTETASIWHAERWTFNNSRFSDYTQPPVLAQAVKVTYDAFIKQGREQEALDFLRDVYSGTKALYDYHDIYLRYSPDCALVILIHPHQSGRDQNTGLNGFKWFPPLLDRNGKNTYWLKDLARVPLDYAQVMALNVRQRVVNWEVEKARQNYCKVDVEYNVRYARNLRILSGIAEELGECEDREKYSILADEIEEQSQRRLYVPEAEWPLPNNEKRKRDGKFTKGLFLNLDGNGHHEQEVSISNLSAIGYSNLTPQQVRACARLGLISFNTMVPFSSVPTDSRDYDPANQQIERIHTGGGWAYQMRLVADGFREHAQRDDLGDYTAYLCELMADMAAYAAKKYFLPLKPEFVNPETGEPQRYSRVRGFGMSGQANLMEHYDHLSRLMDDETYFRLCSALGRIVLVTPIEDLKT